MKKLLLTYLLLLTFIGYSQQAQTVYGQNRVQHQQLEWKYISTKNFNVYYCVGKEANALAHNTARHLETIYDDLTNSVGYLPYNRINVVVYTNDADLQQSNMSLKNTYSAGGETTLVKSKIEVSFKGSQVEYYKELKTELAKLFINIIMYGGNFRDAVQSSYLIEFPEWFLSGAAHYIGNGESEEMYDAVQDFLTKRKLNLDKLTGEKATLVGASIFNYIEKEHGKYAIANILSLAKSTRSEEVGIRAGLGMNYLNFLESWAFTHEEILNNTELDETVEHSALKLKRSSRHSKITQQKVSPDKSKVAYAINRKGIYYVFTKDLITKKKELIYYGGIKDITGASQKNIPLIAWKNNEELSLLKFKKGKPYLLTKNINKRLSKEKKLFVTFESITSFDFHPNGKEIVLSGIKKGQSDIFVYNVRQDVAKRITSDLYDDFNPVYSPSGEKILFSSNRLNDTLRADPGKYTSITSDYNLFEFTGSKVLNKISNSPLNETLAEYESENHLFFISSNGIKNQLFEINTGEKIASKIQLKDKNIFSFSLTEMGLIYRVKTRGRDYLFADSYNTKDKSGNYLLIRESPEQTLEDTAIVPNAVLLNKLLEINPFETAYDSDPVDRRKKVEKITTFTQNQVRISYPQEVDPQFGIDYIISTIKIDPIRNLGALFEVGTSDMFGDHRFSGSLYTSLNLRSYDLNFRYDYLKRKIDFSALAQHDTYLRSSTEALALERLAKTDVSVMLSLPFSPVARLSLNSGFSRTTFVNHYSLNGLPSHNLYGKSDLSFVYDNTTEKSLNQLQGFRLKSSFSYHGKISGTAPGFTKFTFDARNYQPIFKDMVFATRLSYGSYGGGLPRVFVMGGVDNWVFQQYEDNEEFDPFYYTGTEGNPYLLYSDFTTNLRGFGYNKINGNKHLLMSSELRIPIIKMLYSSPISSSFFRNLQVNLFYEIGSAWSGSNPFNKQNSINTRTIGGPPSPFTATVTNYQNPFLSSYGFGFRSMLFGYYMKADLGWGIQNFVVQTPKLQVSLGYDF